MQANQRVVTMCVAARSPLPGFSRNTYLRLPEGSRGLILRRQASASPRRILDRVAQQLGILQFADWYGVDRHVVIQKGGKELFADHTTLAALLKAAYPEHPWEENKFKTMGRAGRLYWTLDRQRALLEEIARKLGVKELSDWYTKTRKDVLEQGGNLLIKKHGNLHGLLRVLYPKYTWQAEKFSYTNRTPPGYWKDQENLIQALEEVEKKMGIESVDDWYAVSLADLRELGFATKINKPKLMELLIAKYPDHKWDAYKLLKGRYAQQKRFENAVTRIFKGTDILINARTEANLVHPQTGEFMELDVYIPSLNLAFEFQEKHHFLPSDFTSLGVVQEKDKVKKEVAQAKGITLITIPFWWDGTIDSLKATIKMVRPDIKLDLGYYASPISTVMPLDTSKDIPHIEGIGAPVTAVNLTSTSLDPSNWWLFEKYDGVRGFWNPFQSCFYSRHGNKLSLPSFVVDSMPKDIFLDGEIWFGRDNFQEAMKVVHRRDIDIDWTKLKFMVFDIPTHSGTYEERYKTLEDKMKDFVSPYIEVAPRQICKDTEHLEEFFQEVIEKGGEGVILRDPTSVYTPGRSPGYLKHKKFRDAEAKVVQKHGLFQWECELPNGVRFMAQATSHFARKWDPSSGTVVTFKHHGFLPLSKKPKFPTLYRIREDMTWEDVVTQWKAPRTPKFVPPIKRSPLQQRPRGYWKNVANRRKFFTEFAAERKFDPLVASNWAGISPKHILAKNGGGALLRRFIRKGGASAQLQAALRDSFPEFDSDGIGTAVKYDWDDVEDRKKFFITFAKKMGFDPLKKLNWARVTALQIREEKGSGLLAKYKYNMAKALEDTFPEMQSGGLYYKNLEHCKEFFLAFAETKKMDPMKPESWYAVDFDELLALPGGLPIAKKFKGLKPALSAVLPDVPFDPAWIEGKQKNLIK